MGAGRTVARQPSSPERRPVSPAALERSSSAATRSPVALQQRLGNQRVAQFVARTVQRESTLPVSSPHDPAEREATSVASAVMRMPDPAAAGSTHASSGPAMVQRCAACGTTGGSCSCGGAIQRAASSSPAATPPSATADIQRNLSGGSPLPAAVKGFMEPRFGADFSGVRIHTDQRAAQLSAGVNANAFAVGSHVFFGHGQYRPDTPRGKELIAHELTHTVQQGASPQSAKVQRQEKSWWESFVDFSEDFGWSVVRRISPSLEPIIRNGAAGVFDWLKTKVTSGVERVFSAVTAPVRAIAGVGDRLSSLFGPMAVSIQAAAAKIAQNDCSPIREAAEKIEQTALKIITPIVEFVQPVVAKVKTFLSDLWDTLGAPVWEWIKQYAADQWQAVKDIASMIQAAAQWIWDKTATIRSVAERAWTWLKNKIGIGEGVEGQNGILQWVQHKLEAAWDWLKAKLEPFKREILTIVTVVGAVLIAVSPAGPILAIGAAVAGAVQGLRWIAANWGKGNAIVQARAYLEKTLFPQLTGAAQRLAASITKVANSISTSLGSLASGLLRAVGAVAGSLLSFAVSAIQWIADQAVKLAAWAQHELEQLATWATAALDRLRTFLDGVMAFLAKVASVVIDIWGLPLMLAGKVWNWVPACIRDPIVDFLGPIILRQIEIFQELAKDGEAWQKTKADIAGIIKLVFKDHDLVGAVKATFRLVLRVFNIPPDLLTTIWQKALAAWDVISKKPLEFIKNTVRSLGHGFKLLWTNIWDHLKFGLQGWLFGELAEKKINPPSSWTDPKAVFNFALEVLGISVDHMFELLAKKFDPAKVARLRLWFGRISGAIDWINKAIDTSKSPAENARGLIDQAKDFGLSILSGIAEWVVGKIAEEVAIMAAAAAASGGLSEIVDIVRRIYKAILTAVRWARRVLDMVNQALDTVLDIAAGSVEKVGAKFEAIMHRGMPIIIGFLADQVGLGGIGTAIRGIVDKLREKVDKAILWLIDKVKAGIEALIGAVKAGVEAVTDWWKARKKFTADDGQEHDLFFEGTEDSAQLMVKSDKKTVEQFLAEFPDKSTPEFQAAQAAFIKSKQIIYSPAKKTDEEKARRKQLVEQELLQISAALSHLVDVPGPNDYPPSSEAKYELSGGKASRNYVETICGEPQKGSAPHAQGLDSDTPGWQRVFTSKLTTQPDKWVQMHVVSEALGGHGDRRNLIAAPNSINTGPFLQLELKTKAAAAKAEKKIKTVMWYDVRVSWRGGADKDFAEKISGKAGLNIWKGKTEKWKKVETPVFVSEATVPRPDFHEQKKISLNFSGKTDLATVISPASLVRLIAENRPYATNTEFVDKVNATAKNSSLGDIKADLITITKLPQIVLEDVAPTA